MTSDGIIDVSLRTWRNSQVMKKGSHEDFETHIYIQTKREDFKTHIYVQV